MAVNKAAIVACAMLVLAGPALAEKQKSVFTDGAERVARLRRKRLHP